MLFEVGSLVWLKNPQPNTEQTWLPASINALERKTPTEGIIKVKTDSAIFQLKFPWGETESDEVKPRNISTFSDKDDLTELPFLNEPEMLLNLKNRFEHSKIYTNAGPILVAINPFDEVTVPDSAVDAVRKFVAEMKLQSSRHFEQYSKVLNHSIVLSGESGSGKTESFKLLLNILGRSSTDDDSRQEWFEKTLLTNRVLESFGNATTMHTVNSTRFGKLVDLTMNSRGEMVQFTTRTYLLESSRTTMQQSKERNFNIFYQLLAGASSEEKRRWKLTKPCTHYHYTNQGLVSSQAESNDELQSILPMWEKLDAENFAKLKEALSSIGFSPAHLNELFDILAGIIHLGQIIYTDRNDLSGGSTITHDTENPENDPLILAANFFGISAEQLEEITTARSFISRGEKIIRPLSTAAAKIARDAVAKAIYRGLFDWVVNNINAQLSKSIDRVVSDSSSSIILVDIFGFDSFQYNSMDQLCNNYSNEILQQLYNFNVFKKDVLLYKEEGVEYDELKFADNKDNIDLIANGIFRILDDQCRLPDPTDKRFVAQLYKEFQNHKLFSAIHQQQLDSKFTVQHFSGPVEYTADDFITKNLDNLPTDTGKLLLSSSNSILVSLAQGDHHTAGSVKRRSSLAVDQNANNDNKTSARSSTTAPSFVTQVKADIQLFLKDLEPTEIHYIRCIKPFNPERNWQFNRKKAARSNANQPIRFSNIKVTDQLRYGGILEAIKMTRMKFRAHMSYPAFFDHYRLIVDRVVFEGVKITPTTEIDKAKEIVRKLLSIIASTNINSLHGKDAASKKAPVTSFPKEESNSDRRKDLRQTLSKSISKTEIQKILKSRSGSAGAEMNLADATLLDASKVQLGFRSVFLKVKEYEILEALRNASIVDHVVTIQKIIRRVYWQRTYKKMKTAILLMLRMTRGFTARLRVKRLKLLRKTVIILQKTFRARRLIRKANRIIRAYRCYCARKLAGILRAKKAKLTATFGPLLTARAMRWKRRGLLTLLPNHLANGVGIIAPLEIRFAEYFQEEMELIGNIMALISGSRLQDTQLQGEIEFDEIIKEFIVPIRLLPSDNSFKNLCIAHFKKICLPEHLLKLRKLTDSTGFFGRFFGASAWKSVGKSLGSDIPPVNLDAEHGLFGRVRKVAHIAASLKEHGQREIAELERKRQSARTSGVTASPGKSPDGKNIDSLIGELTTQIKATKRLCTLLEILERFYLHFVTGFVRNYGPDSEFHRKYPSEKAYLQDLIEVVRAAKRFIPTPLGEEKKKEIQAENEAKNASVYSVGNCPLKVEWKEPLTIPTSDLTAYKNNHSEVKKILANLDLKKREFYADNLRILEFDGIGYQYNPHDPAIAYAMNSFNQFLGGARLITARRLIKISGTRQLLGTVTYYQATNGLKKTSLLDVLYNPVHVEQLDSFSFSLTVISCMVLGLFNLQPNNLLVDFQKKPNGMNNIKITDFNPDMMLSAEFLDFTNPNRYRIHAKNLNVLFFLPLMDEPVDPDVRAFLTSSPYMAEEIIVSWLRDLYDQNRRFAALRSAGFTVEDFRALGIPLLLPGGATIEIRRRLNRVCRLLRTKHRREEDHSPVTLSGLLESLFPTIGKYYADYRADADFSEDADSDGIVSFAYVYHKALDTERTMATRKGGLFASAANATGEQGQPQGGGGVLGGIFPFMKKNEQEDDAARMGDFAESNDSGSSRSSRSASPVVDRMQSQSGFSYDQVFIDDSENIPDFHEEDPEELGMIMTANAMAKSSESDAPNGMVRLYSMTSPDGAEIPPDFSFDEVYDQENEFSHEAPSPFQVVRRAVTMKLAGPNVDTTAAVYERQQQLVAAQHQQQQANPDVVPDTANPLKNARTGQRPSISAGVSPASSAPSTTTGAQKRNTFFNDNEGNSSAKKASRTSSNFNIGDIYNSSVDEQIPTGNEGTATAEKNTTPKRSSLPGGPSTPASEVVSPGGAKKRGTFFGGSSNETPVALEKSAIKYEAPPEEFRQRMGAQKKAQQRAADRFLPPEAQRHSLLLRTIEEEGFKFFNSLDFRDFADERPSGQAEEFCEIIGRNLTFMSSLWLNHINDWQFKALFRYWVKAKANKTLLVPGLKAITRETILRYSNRAEMEQMQNCSALSKLLKRFNIQLKFAVLSAEAANNEIVSQANVDRTHRKKSLAPMNPEQYDIYTFVNDHPSNSSSSRQPSMKNLEASSGPNPLTRQLSTPGNPGFNSTDEPSEEELAFLKEFQHDLTVEQEKISRKLYRNFWACVNRIKHSELVQYDQDIANIKDLIRILVKNEPITKITVDQLRSVTDLLIVYPLLAPMAILLAERRAFSRDLNILHRLLTSPYVDKYEDILFSIIENHPEVLIKPNEDFLLPCDIIKKIHTERLLTYKYELLSKFIQYMTTHTTTRSFQFINKGIFSQYLLDEELLVLASFYDFHPTGPELKFRKFNLLKTDSTSHSITLLMKLLLSERDCLKTNTTEFDLIWKVYQLLLRSLAKRVLKGEMTLQQSEEYLWKSIDLNEIPTAYKKEKKILSMEEFEKTSRVYQDLLANWSSAKRVKHSFRLRKMASKKFINSPSPARIGNLKSTGGSTAGKKGGPLKLTGSPPKSLPSPFKPTQPLKSSSTSSNSIAGGARGPAATSPAAANKNANGKATASPKSPAPQQNSPQQTYNTPFSRLFGSKK